MNGNPRDTGLVRALGPWALAASVVSIVIGAGIFAAPGAIAAAIGPWGPLAFLGCSLAVGAVAVCFAEGGSRIATSGGPYGYIEASLGPLAGFIAGSLKWCGSVLSCAAVAAALADVVTSVTPSGLTRPIHAAVIIVVVGGTALINVRGVRSGVRLIGVATVLKLLPLFVFVLVGAAFIHRANFAVPAAVSAADPGRAVILALFAFTGMETALCASGEVAQPARTIPRGLALALVTITVLYVGIQTVAQGILGPALAGSTVPLAAAMARVNPALRALMLAGAALSMLGCVGADILGSPRMIFALARDGLLPRVLGRVHERTHVPHVAILFYSGLIMVFALTGAFAELAAFAALTVAALYVAGCIAAWRLARRGVASAGAPLGFRWLGAAAIVGIGGMLIIIALASRAEFLGLLALIAASIAWYFLHPRTTAAAA